MPRSNWIYSRQIINSPKHDYKLLTVQRCVSLLMMDENIRNSSFFIFISLTKRKLSCQT
nr:MAG TPA: hypothetical protein [Bacteriophage sp.]